MEVEISMHLSSHMLLISLHIWCFRDVIDRQAFEACLSSGNMMGDLTLSPQLLVLTVILNPWRALWDQ